MLPDLGVLMPVNVQTAIEDFWTARARGEYFPQAYFDRLTLDDAYHIQLGIIDRRVAAGDHHDWVVRQFPLGPGDIAVAEFSGIGRVEVKIAAA
jgi:hypothetical protein